MTEWRLLPHTIQWSNEADILDYLESTKKSKLTIEMLKSIVQKCQAESFHYALVFLGDLIIKITGRTPYDLYDEVHEFLDGGSSIDESSPSAAPEDLTKTSTIKEVASWLSQNLSVHASPSTTSVLKNLNEAILETALHYHHPCSPHRIEGNGFATWIEQKLHLGPLLAAKNPRFSEFLPIIVFLSKKPFLDCSSPHHVDADLPIFDKKWEKWLNKYPLINYMLDPPLVVVELVAAGPQNMTLEQLMTNILNQFQGPLAAGLPLSLPSGQIPRFLHDVAGPPDSTFFSLIECTTLEDANILGGILRSHYRSASGHGGVVGGATVRIGVLATTARGVRVF